MKHNTYSKLFHLVVLCSFLLPFFYVGCGPTAVEKKKAEDKRIQDSIETLQNKGDSIKVDSYIVYAADTSKTEIDSIKVDTSKVKINHSVDTLSKDNNSDKDECYAIYVSHKLPFLKPILVLGDNIFTGLGMAINAFPYLPYFSIFVSMLLLILTFIIKIIDFMATRAIVLLEIVAIAFLLLSRLFIFATNPLWGFWVCVIVFSLMIIYDIFLMLKYRKTVNQ